jgi:hypothetical protein
MAHFRAIGHIKRVYEHAITQRVTTNIARQLRNRRQAISLCGACKLETQTLRLSTLNKTNLSPARCPIESECKCSGRAHIIMAVTRLRFLSLTHSHFQRVHGVGEYVQLCGFELSVWAFGANPAVLTNAGIAD